MTETPSSTRSGSDPNGLHLELAREILDWINERGFAAGHHLREEEIANNFGVSRSPVRKALGVLSGLGVVLHEPNRGFFLSLDAREIEFLADGLPSTADDDLYQKLAHAWFDREMPETVGEAELMRRFAPPSRKVLSRALRRLSADGIISAVFGRGWRLEPTLATEAAFDQSYRFRVIIEPAAILLDSFRLQTDLAAIVRRRHEAILARRPGTQRLKVLVDADIQFHDLIGRSCNNQFFAQAIERQNALRRLTEHLANLESGRLHASCAEHMLILDALDAGNQAEAAERMRDHLTIASDFKPTYD